MRKHRCEHEFYTSKATLLIRHIHCLYTMEEKAGEPVLIRDAFLAVHHDFIMAVGMGEGRAYCDKDTQIIDAYGTCVVPGFMECAYQFLSAKVVPSLTDHELLMQARKLLGAMTAGGTTLINLYPYEDERIQKRMSRVYESLRKLQEVTLSEAAIDPAVLICRTFHQKLAASKQPFCISTGMQGMINDLFLAAKLYYQRTKQSPYEILKAMTVNPAASMHCLHERGILKADMQADFVILQSPDLETAFSALAPSSIARVYRSGNCIWQGRLHH